MRSKRMLAILICCVYIAALLVPGAFISAHAGHDCTGEDCEICLSLSSLERLMRTLSATLIAMGFVMLGSAVLHARRHIARLNYHACSLVSLKVKLTN